VAIDVLPKLQDALVCVFQDTVHFVDLKLEFLFSELAAADLLATEPADNKARAFRLLSLEKLHVPAVYSNQRLDRHYDVIARDGKLYESEYALDGSGTEIFREEHQLEWIVGAGANGIGGIIRRGDYLFEAPLTFYTGTKTWEMSPGYESMDVGFSRPILTACLNCHSGRSNPISGSEGRYQNDVFSELPIGCENCHGPGGAHIDAVASGAMGKGRGVSIVNPARLTPDLANNICMKCHEIGDERILKPGKEYKDIRPGEPLDNTLSIFITPPRREAPPDKDHLQHYSMP
jgi:hypothetical protein